MEHMKTEPSAYNIKTIRLGDCINFPSKGQIIGVHYILRDQNEKVMESTYEWGKIFEWKVGSPSIVEEVDDAIRKVSLGGKALITVDRKQIGKENQRLIYEVELMYIK